MGEVTRFFAAKDFFNYYLAGAIWLADALLALALIGSVSPFDSSALKFSKSIIDSTGPLPLAVAVGILPYIVGVVLSPMGNLTTKWMRRSRDPAQWVTDYSNDAYLGRRVRKHLLRQAAHHVLDLELGAIVIAAKLDPTPTLSAALVDKETIRSSTELQKWLRAGKLPGRNKVSLPFAEIYAYVLEYGGAGASRATRALDLANLMESLILPVPILAVLTGVAFLRSNFKADAPGRAGPQMLIHYVGNGLCISLVLATIAAALFLMGGYRYLKLREYWVKHTYRAFVVMRTGGDRPATTNSR